MDPRGHDSSHTLPLGTPLLTACRKRWTAQWTGLLAASKWPETMSLPAAHTTLPGTGLTGSLAAREGVSEIKQNGEPRSRSMHTWKFDKTEMPFRSLEKEWTFQ